MSKSKPPVSVATRDNSVTASPSERMVTAVLPRLRPRLAKAMLKGLTVRALRPRRHRLPPPSV